MESTQNACCQSHFKSGPSMTTETYTKAWINLINQVEKNKNST